MSHDSQVKKFSQKSRDRLHQCNATKLTGLPKEIVEIVAAYARDLVLALIVYTLAGPVLMSRFGSVSGGKKHRKYYNAGAVALDTHNSSNFYCDVLGSDDQSILFRHNSNAIGTFTPEKDLAMNDRELFVHCCIFKSRIYGIPRQPDTAQTFFMIGDEGCPRWKMGTILRTIHNVIALVPTKQSILIIGHDQLNTQVVEWDPEIPDCTSAHAPKLVACRKDKPLCITKDTTTGTLHVVTVSQPKATNSLVFFDILTQKFTKTVELNCLTTTLVSTTVWDASIECLYLTMSNLDMSETTVMRYRLNNYLLLPENYPLVPEQLGVIPKNQFRLCVRGAILI